MEQVIEKVGLRRTASQVDVQQHFNRIWDQHFASGRRDAFLCRARGFGLDINRLRSDACPFRAVVSQPDNHWTLPFVAFLVVYGATFILPPEREDEAAADNSQEQALKRLWDEEMREKMITPFEPDQSI